MYQFALLPLQGGGEEFAVDSTTMLAAMVIGFLIGVAIAVGAGYWVYKDASKRENNELAWGIGIGALLFFFFPIGIIALIVYIIFRGDETESEPMSGDATGDEW